MCNDIQDVEGCRRKVEPRTDAVLFALCKEIADRFCGTAISAGDDEIRIDAESICDVCGNIVSRFPFCKRENARSHVSNRPELRLQTFAVFNGAQVAAALFGYKLFQGIRGISESPALFPVKPSG